VISLNVSNALDENIFLKKEIILPLFSRKGTGG